MSYKWTNDTYVINQQPNLFITNEMLFDNKVVNVERIDSGNQLAAAFGQGSVSRNRITIGSQQLTDDVDLVELAKLQKA